ncbi:uncharacterized protein [Watersipora subatra]|uniref:uncharacterized protein isoform X2 n=1 Tax=Watersipora subatra TaxID=2589382 RepID=UPI00355B683E
MSDTQELRLAQLNRVRTDEHSERRRLLRRSYALDVPSLVMSHCEVGSKDESSVSANIACQLDYDRGMNTVPIIKADKPDVSVEKNSTLVCELPITCSTCHNSISSPSFAVQDIQCSQKQVLESGSTLQLPTSRNRCDSGNGSDNMQSSGNVSPAYSDYGGGRIDADEQNESLRKTPRKCTTNPTSYFGDEATTPIIPEDQQLISHSMYGDESSVLKTIESTTPTVKLWPVYQINEARVSFENGKYENNPDNSQASFHSADFLNRSNLNWRDDAEREDWLNDTAAGIANDFTETVEGAGNEMPQSTDVILNEMESCVSNNFLPPGLVRCQTNDHPFVTRPPFVCETRRLSDAVSSIQDRELMRSRPSLESLSSLDGYFSQIHFAHYDYHDNLPDSPFAAACPLSQAPKAKANVPNAPVGSASRRSPSPNPSRSQSEAGTSTTSSPKPTKRRSLRERLSEKQLAGLKIDIGLKESIQSNSAPIGENAVSSLFASYSHQADSISLDSALHTPNSPTYLLQFKNPQKRWQALKGIMPFMESYRKKKWVQLAGHQDSFEQSSEDSLVLKKFSPLEYTAFDKILHDPLNRFVPKRYNITTKNSRKFVELENLLHGFTSPSVMDCKIGVRTYLEEELIKAERCPTPRKDMYEKMMKIDPAEPTKEEHLLQAVSKPRYMQWREKISSSSTLGFRIEGIKCTDGQSCINFKTSKDKLTIKTIMSGFLNNDPVILEQYLTRLEEFRNTLCESKFFRSHEVIGSSLLFVHGGDKAGVWMIDFGKTTPLPAGVTITHDQPWERGNHEDGYLTGLDNLIALMKNILEDCRTCEKETVSDSSDNTHNLIDNSLDESEQACQDISGESANTDSMDESTTDSDSQHECVHMDEQILTSSAT